MSDIILTGVSDLLQGFDLAEISEIIKEQIEGEYSTDYTSVQIDHFKPIYIAYKKLLDDEDAGEDDLNEAKDRFYGICSIIINMVEKKFNFSVSETWLENNSKNIPALAMALYDFFVVNFYRNQQEVIQNYIVGHMSEILDAFSALKGNKDTASTANRKSLSPEMTLIASNIYDIVDWILAILDETMYLDTMDPGYVSLIIIKNLYENGDCDGSFVSAIHNIYKSSLPLKSQLGYDILYKIKDGQIDDPYPKAASQDAES